ncbi:MAG: hypothetical protein ABL903_18830 [Methylococcales bacterium]
MSEAMSSYTFLPWLRQGLANNIADQDFDASVKIRAKINITLKVNAVGIDATPIDPTLVSKSVSLYGPGDIIGIDSSAIVKVEPRNWITNFEPNYLPYIEFYDEDFPWRYTPAAPNTGNHRLRPWIMLVVLKEDEFTDGARIAERPLSFITLKAEPSTLFPKAEELWAWAHVHINNDIVQADNLSRTSNTATILPKITEVIDRNPDLAYSRILCPRQLEANTAYHAFLIPVFESGRLAGLGLNPDTSPAEVHATFSAWANYANKPSANDLPFYHRWYFRTGTVGDFEYLVRLLQPRPVDSRVGLRDMDVQQPMVNFPGIRESDLGGLLKLGGALQVPFTGLAPADQQIFNQFDQWAVPYPDEFQIRLAKFINLADDYAQKNSQQANSAAQAAGLEHAVDPQTGDIDPDPLITPPIYGRWHAMVTRVLHERDDRLVPNATNWVNDLNLDPRWRVAAGFGTKIIQDKQEEYMDAAWGQVGEVIEANRRLRLAELAKRTAMVWYTQHLQVFEQKNREQALRLTTPLHMRILTQDKTAHHQIKISPVPNAVISPTMRRILRPRGRLMRAMDFNPQINAGNLITRLNDQEITPAPPKQIAATLPTVNDVAADARPNALPDFLLDWLKKNARFIYLALMVLILILLVFAVVGIIPALQIIAVPMIAAASALIIMLRRLLNNIQRADSILPENQTPEAVEALPNSPDFRVSMPGSGFTASLGASDSQEAIYYKAALTDSYRLVQLSIQAAYQPPPVKLDMQGLVADTFMGIHPAFTLPRYIFGSVYLPDWMREDMSETFKPAMAYPEFDIPMYKPLIDISTEHFLPNLNFIGQNTISLLETNQKFIEAYMVGLNHEFARELLWREYPTDQRGSYFRQFWDVSSYLNRDNQDPLALREKLRDIPPLHMWSRRSDLGQHDHRKAEGEKAEDTVLVIRGELLKKYPTAVIYAHKAKWQRKADNTIDVTLPRELEDTGPIETLIRTPLYQAKVEPDIYFLGFDLKVNDAKGGSGENEADDPGWFFVIKERPGEPRFGLDIERDKTKPLHHWNDLAWSDVLPNEPVGVQFIKIKTDTTSTGIPSFRLEAPPQPANNSTRDANARRQQENVMQQHLEDVQVQWNDASNAAELAYILYQAPVLIGVHAAEMLP